MVCLGKETIGKTGRGIEWEIQASEFVKYYRAENVEPRIKVRKMGRMMRLLKVVKFLASAIL